MTGASAWSVALVGMQGSMVEVEAAISSGLPRTVRWSARRGPSRSPRPMPSSRLRDGIVMA